jgi:hypothetical protein
VCHKTVSVRVAVFADATLQIFRRSSSFLSKCFSVFQVINISVFVSQQCLLSLFVAAVSAGGLVGAPLAYSAPAYSAYAAPAVVKTVHGAYGGYGGYGYGGAYASPYVHSYAAPAVVKSYAAPAVAYASPAAYHHASPVATSYANTYKVSSCFKRHERLQQTTNPKKTKLYF